MPSDDMIPVPSIDAELPSGPLRRNRRRTHKESRSATMGGRKEGDTASRRAARVSKQRNNGSKNGDMLKGYRVIVSGMLPSCTESQVRSLFRSVGGRILKITMGRQAGTNKPVGVAEVVFETSAQADKAARTLNRASVDGRVISVQTRGLAFITKGGKSGKSTKDSKKGRGGKSGPKKEKKQPETKESLDQALQAYMAPAAPAQ